MRYFCLLAAQPLCARKIGPDLEESAPSIEKRLAVLDGWRGISVLLILAAHLLSPGPKVLQLNETAGPMGMALPMASASLVEVQFYVGVVLLVRILSRPGLLGEGWLKYAKRIPLFVHERRFIDLGHRLSRAFHARAVAAANASQ